MLCPLQPRAFHQPAEPHLIPEVYCIWLHYAGTIGGWMLLPDAVINHPLTTLDNPREMHSVMIVKYRGDRPQQDRSTIYLQAVLHSVSTVRASFSDALLPCVLQLLSHGDALAAIVQ